MIIGHALMEKLGLLAEFKRKVLQWDSGTTPMKEPGGMLSQTYITRREIHEVVMQTAEPVSTREATERLVKYSVSPIRSKTFNR